MNRAKRITRWLRIIFTSKELSDSSVTDLWLIPFFNTTIKELEALDIYKDSRAFYADHRVGAWKERVWNALLVYIVRRQSVIWFAERRFPFFSRYKLTRKQANRDLMWVKMSYGPGVNLKD